MTPVAPPACEMDVLPLNSAAPSRAKVMVKKTNRAIKVTFLRRAPILPTHVCISVFLATDVAMEKQVQKDDGDDHPRHQINTKRTV